MRFIWVKTIGHYKDEFSFLINGYFRPCIVIFFCGPVVRESFLICPSVKDLVVETRFAFCFP